MRRLHAARPWSWGFAALATAFAVWAWQEAPDAQAGPAAAGPAIPLASPALSTAPMTAPEPAPGAGQLLTPAAARHADEAWDAHAAIRQASSYAEVIERLMRRRAPGDLQLATQLAQFCMQAQGWRLPAHAGADQRAAWQSAQGRCASLGPQPASTLAALRAQRQATTDGWLGWQSAWEQAGTTARRQMLSQLKDPRFLLDALFDPRTRWSAGGWSQDAHNRLTLSDSALQWSLCQSLDSCQAGLGPQALQGCVEDGLCASSDQAFWQAAVAREEAAMPMAEQQLARGQREALARVIRQGSWQELDWQPAPATRWVKAQTTG